MPRKYTLLNKYLIRFFFLPFIFFMSGCDIPFSKKTQSPGHSKCRPYSINGRRYIPQKHYELNEKGYASYYGGKDGMHGCITCTGEPFSMFAMTAAHKTLPVPSLIEVTNLENGKKVILRVNDRGPFARNRILDVSALAARRLGFYHKGYAKVRVRTLVQKSQKLAQRTISVKRLAPPKKKTVIDCWYYLCLKTSSMTQARKLLNHLREYGQIHTHRTFLGVHIMIGPYRCRESALEMKLNIPVLKNALIVKKCRTYPSTHIKK